MMKLIFKKYNNTPLDRVNKILYKNSNGRFELFKSTSGYFYMIDYDELGYYRIIRAYREIDDILSCMHLDFNKIKEEC